MPKFVRLIMSLTNFNLISMETNTIFSKKSDANLIKICLVTIVILLFLLFKSCDVNKDLQTENIAYEVLTDSLKTWKDQQGLSHSEKQIIETKDPKTFLELKTKDKEILRLQEVVKKYKKKLGKSGSVTYIEGETIIDTFYTKPIVLYKDQLFYKDSIKNKWIDWRYEVSRGEKDSVDFKLKMHYEYAVINKEKNNGWFKKSTPYAEIVNFNPYSSTLSLTTYKVVNDIKPKRFGIGPVIAYGIGSNFTPQVFIGFGANLNLIQ